MPLRAPIALSLILAGGAGLALGPSGCVVWRRDYDSAVASAAGAKAASDARDRDQTARLLDLQQRLTAAEAGVQDRDGRVSELSTSLHNLQAQLDEATAINQELRAALERMGKDADKLLAERGTLSKSLDDARARLDELRRAQAAAEVRIALFRDFQQRFAALIQAGQMRIESRRGNMVMNVSGDLLFEPGHAELRSTGKGALMEIAHAIQTTSAPSTARRFLVTDDVDNEPTKSKRWRSAWELTAARGAAVVEYLVSLGVRPESLAAAGAGSSDPQMPNDTAEGRAANRRVEIALLPAAEAEAGAPPALAAGAAAPHPPPASSAQPPPLPAPAPTATRK